MSTETGVLRLSYTDDIALVELTNPAQRNPMTQKLKDALSATAHELRTRKGLQGVIITGSDGVFCAGGDLKGMYTAHQADRTTRAEDMLGRMRHLHDWVRILRDLPVPVISAVDGPVFGAGLGLALVADLVLSTDRATFNASFCKVGVVPDAGLFYSLPRSVGAQRARELFFTGRVVSAEEALRIGLVMELVSPDALMDRAWEMARMMVQSSPTAFALTKAISGRALESDAETLANLEAQAQSICLTSAYHIDAVDRFVNKQPLRFNFK